MPLDSSLSCQKDADRPTQALSILRVYGAVRQLTDYATVAARRSLSPPAPVITPRSPRRISRALMRWLFECCSLSPGVVSAAEAGRSLQQLVVPAG